MNHDAIEERELRGLILNTNLATMRRLSRSVVDEMYGLVYDCLIYTL
jgi:hypothetical protein